MKPTGWVGAGTCLALGWLVGCRAGQAPGAGDGRGAGTPAQAALAVASPARARPSPAAPDEVVPLPRIDDVAAELARLHGRVVVFFLWHAGDRQAVGLVAGLNALRRGYPEASLELLGVPVGEPRGVVGEVAREADGWRLLSDPEDGGRWMRLLEARGLPAVLVFDREGSRHWHGHPGRRVGEVIAELLGQPASTGPAEAEGRRVEGLVSYAGAPFVTPDGACPRLWFRDEWAGTEVRFPSECDPRTGRFTLSQVAPGLYGVQVSIGAFPDDRHAVWRSWDQFVVPASAAARTIEVNLHRLIHLVSPIDNWRILPPSGTLGRHRSPVRFAWEPVPEASAYRWAIRRARLKAESEEYPTAYRDGRLAGTEVVLDLEPGFEYHFDLNASRGDLAVGHLEVKGENYRGWDYRFVIE